MNNGFVKASESYKKKSHKYALRSFVNFHPGVLKNTLFYL